VLFFAPIDTCAAAPRSEHYIRGVAENGEKRWRTDQVGSLTQISKDTALSRKQVSSVFDSLSGVIKKSPAGNGLFTMPGLIEVGRL